MPTSAETSLGAGHNSSPQWIQKQPNLSRKPRPSATQPSRKPKPLVLTPYRRPKDIVPWPSRKLKPPVLTPYRRLKHVALCLSEMQRPGESAQDSTLQKSHAKSILHLEEQAIEEENKSQLDFLSVCQTALWASPAELHSMQVASYQVLMGQMQMSLLFNPSEGASSSEQVPTPMASFSPAPEPSPRPKWWHPSPDPVDVLPPSRATSQANLTGLPSSKWQKVMLLYKAHNSKPSRSIQLGLPLVRETREE